MDESVAGLVVGGIAGVIVARIDLHWQAALALTPLPALVEGTPETTEVLASAAEQSFQAIAGRRKAESASE